MGHPARIYLPDFSLHIMRRGNDRCAIVRDDTDREELLRIFGVASTALGVSVHGFTVMTTHYHLIATPQRANALSQMMKAVGERYVRYYNARYDRIGTLWSGRYRAIVIADERYWLTCLRYIEQNAWRAKMVSGPESYAWSSCRMHALGETIDWLVPHAVYLGLGATPEKRQEAYRAICGVMLTDDELAQQRHPPTKKRVSDVSDTPDDDRQQQTLESVSDVSDTP